MNSTKGDSFKLYPMISNAHDVYVFVSFPIIYLILCLFYFLSIFVLLFIANNSRWCNRAYFPKNLHVNIFSKQTIYDWLIKTKILIVGWAAKYKVEYFYLKAFKNM